MDERDVQPCRHEEARSEDAIKEIHDRGGLQRWECQQKQVGGDEIEVGGSELYEPRCSIHFPILFELKSQ